MSFARAYLQKAALRPALIREVANPDLQLIVTIPVHRESGLVRCLDSLFKAAEELEEAGGSGNLSPEQALFGSFSCVEVILLVNAAEDASAEVLEQNLATRQEALDWIQAHPHPQMQVHVLLDHAFPPKYAGVGLARKILMDEAVQRFAALEEEGAAKARKGIIASLDADTVVDPAYFTALITHFADSGVEGCSIYFEHPLNAEEDPFGDEDTETGDHAHAGKSDSSPDIYKAIAAYELHLRYYLHSLRSTGYPHAFHTVGSAFAVRVSAYCAEGGMNRRQGGEDFYFIQKVAQRGGWTDCTSTRVVPSPRPSDRVPFGTGPAVKELTSGSWPLLTYHPVPFRILQHWLSHMDSMQPGQWASPYPVLNEFLEEQGFEEALKEIRSNSASPAAFRKRFWRWFNMFRIMKFLHFARTEEYPDAEVRTVASIVCELKSIELLDLLAHYRKLDRPGSE